MKKQMRIGDVIRLTAGPCAVCDRDASMVLRATTVCGVPATTRSCDIHEDDVYRLIRGATVETLVMTIHPCERGACARRYRALAAKLQQRQIALDRKSAEMRGASSATHTYYLLAGAVKQEAQGYCTIADALESRQEL